MRIKGRLTPEVYDGTQSYILGDSNTRSHKGYWMAWLRKNFPNSKINLLADTSYRIPTILDQLDNIDPKNTKIIIIGSLGGNDSKILMNSDYIKRLSPDGDYYINMIVPLMLKLKSLETAGVEIKFFGLPYGSSSKNPEREKARAVMDLALSLAAEEYGIDYRTVFERTKNIKGDKTGVHYRGNRKKAYGDYLATLIGGEQPLPGEEAAYARGDQTTGLKKYHFLSPYTSIKEAGFDFNKFYKDIEEAFPGKVGIGKKLLSIHGKDYIFGAEHFKALTILARAKPDLNYSRFIKN